MSQIGQPAFPHLRERRPLPQALGSPGNACRAGMVSANLLSAYVGLAGVLTRYTACLPGVVRPRMVVGRSRAGAGEPVKPVVGMVVAFRPSVEADLADVPARVVAIWPRLRSGEYLVTLEYAQPIAWHREVIQQIEAFMSELYQPVGR